MEIRINPKEVDNIIKALEGGVVPQKGIRHLLVGRNEEVKEVISTLDNISRGNSDIRFWVGDFGSGKSFMLQTIVAIALEKNFVVSTVDLTPSRRFYASDGKARSLYREIIDNLKIQSSQDGKTLEIILQEWINKLAEEISIDTKESIRDILSLKNDKLLCKKIMDNINNFSSAGLSFELGQAIVKFYEGVVTDNLYLKVAALRWIRGDIETKTESKSELQISRIINDDNWYDALKSISNLFTSLGYAGFVLNFDEVVNLYKLPMRQTREKNYERVLNIYNECKTNKIGGLFVNFGVTRKTIFDQHRGLTSYGALKGRLGDEKAMDSKLININRTVLPLKPLSNEEIYTLLDHLSKIYNIFYKSSVILTLNNIKQYMEEQLNRPGADEFLTPRAVIKDYLEILDLIRQNSEITIEEIIMIKFGKNGTAIFKDSDNTDDEIEVL